MVHMPTTEEIAALRQALAEAIGRGDEAVRRNDSLAGELRVVRTERDLLQEQLNRFKRQLFAANRFMGRFGGTDLSRNTLAASAVR